MKNVVVGGGIAGLAAAYRLRNEETVLLEAANRVGGWIDRLEGAPFPFPLGPRTIRCKEGGALLQLIQELGLPLLSPPKGLKRYLYWRGQLHELRWNSPLLKGIRRALLFGFLKPLPAIDLSVADFFRSHFSEEMANRLGIPFLRGIFGQNGEELSLKAAFPRMGRGPLLRHFFGKRSHFVSLPGGVMTLVERLQEILSDKIVLGEEVVAMEKGIVTTTKRALSCERIISTLPFKQMPHTSITSVHLYWKKKIERVSGFGYLVSPEEEGHVLGAIFDSEMAPKVDGTAITVMLSGIVEGEQEALAALKRHLKVDERPDFIKVTYAKEAIPSYPVGYLEKKRDYLKQVEGWLVPLGTSFSGLSVADVVEGAFSWKL